MNWTAEFIICTPAPKYILQFAHVYFKPLSPKSKSSDLNVKCVSLDSCDIAVKI